MFRLVSKGLISLIITLILVCQVAFAQSEKSSFLSIADIHFDPYYGCERAKRPCALITKLRQSDVSQWELIFEENTNKKNSPSFYDTNYFLFKSFLNKAREVEQSEHPAFVLVLGDFIAHNFRTHYIRYSGDKSRSGYENFVAKTYQFLTREFLNTFPTIAVYPVIGNNDSYTGDYSVIPGGKFLSDLSRIWAPLLHDKNNLNNFRNVFPRAGYYVVIDPITKQKIIILNSVLFSNHIHRKMMDSAAENELKWLHQELKNATALHQQVLIVDHIPVGIDAFPTIIKQLKLEKDFWHERFTSQFEKVLIPYSSSILAVLSAHIHIDTLQLIRPKKIGDIPIYITPSISPIFGNNPSFRLFHLANLSNYDTYSYSLDNATW